MREDSELRVSDMNRRLGLFILLFDDPVIAMDSIKVGDFFICYDAAADIYAFPWRDMMVARHEGER